MKKGKHYCTNMILCRRIIYLDWTCYTGKCDMLYRKMPKKAFIKGKKQEIEGILMYCYCCEYCSEDQYWREYSEKLL